MARCIAGRADFWTRRRHCGVAYPTRDPIARASIIRFHRDRVKRHGAGAFGALGWRDAASQRKCFEVIAAAADFTDACVLDADCRHGDHILVACGALGERCADDWSLKPLAYTARQFMALTPVAMKRAFANGCPRPIAVTNA